MTNQAQPFDLCERREARLVDVKVSDAAAEPGRFVGYGAVFGNTDSYGDVIEKGAFSESLGEWGERGKLPPMLLQHGGWGIGSDDMLPIGKWLSMEENTKGLKVEGQLFALGTERGQYVYEGLKSGVLDGLSIGFQIREQTNGTKPNEPERTLTNIDLWEVSVVTFPANAKARVSNVKSAALPSIREIERAMHQGGLSKNVARQVVAALNSAPQLSQAAPGGMPEARWDAGDGEEAMNDAAQDALARIVAAMTRRFR